MLQERDNLKQMLDDISGNLSSKDDTTQQRLNQLTAELARQSAEHQ